jgi:glutaconate CoA-transferase subunit B
MLAGAYTSDEMMTIAAARMVRNGMAVLVGIGLPGAAANLARLTHAPAAVLIYESGAIGTKPSVLPISIGDSELAETSDTVVGIVELFSYWLTGGKIGMGLLGAAQIDRLGNLNSTVIGPYDNPRVRLPGAGGAPAIAANCPEVLITLRHSTKTFVDQLDFRSTVFVGKTPVAVISDLGILTPDPVTKELELTSVHPAVTVEQVVAATGWPLKVAPQVKTTPAPSALELRVLRDLNKRTAGAC